jgi:isocitrate dehydrogenase
MELIMDKWVKPNMDISAWEFYDLSCKSRDDTEDKVLHDAVDAGKRIGAIFKEPTVTPTEIQKEKLGLKKAWGSPNGAMRRGWNGITISRDTIHIDGMELGFMKPVLFERHAVGGEYAAGWKMVGKGTVRTEFVPDDGSESVVVDERHLKDETSAVVVYDNPLDNVTDLAHHFFSRCLDAHVTPYVVTKKTVFKWQEGFWVAMKDVFDAHYKEKFVASGLLDGCGGDLQHLISDAATMQIIRWTGGGFGMAAHNYDGDMLTDEVAQVHRSPGFITSNLIGKNDDGSLIKEYEASHGTVADMWEAHLRGEETSLNPLGLVEALIGAMQHAENLQGVSEGPVYEWTEKLRAAIHKAMVAGEGTRDLCGPSGLTTEAFVDNIAARIETATVVKSKKEQLKELNLKPPKRSETVTPVAGNIDIEAMRTMFDDLDTDSNGTIDFEEFSTGLVRLGVQPAQFYPEKSADV